MPKVYKVTEKPVSLVLAADGQNICFGTGKEHWPVALVVQVYASKEQESIDFYVQI